MFLNLLVLLGYVLATLDPTFIRVRGVMRHLDSNHVLEYTRYAAAAYCEGPALEKFQCRSCYGLKPRFIKSLGSRLLDSGGYIAIDEPKKRIVLAFRGTRGIQNQISDISAIPVPLFDVPALGALVHVGFKVSMESMAPTFLKTIHELLADPRHRNYKVAVVGHSLGGAIASLAAIRIQSSLGLAWSRIELATYGQPRTGNAIFAKWFSQQPIGSARVVHNADLVPHLAPGALNVYAHHLNEIWIDPHRSINHCRSDILEDPACSHSVPLTNLNTQDHLLYFGIATGRGGC